MTDSTHTRQLNILVLEPFGGDSHASLYRGWQKYSRHRLSILELPAVHWKWRSRHSSLTLAEAANELSAHGESFDAVFCSEMLSLAEWRGFADKRLRELPAVVYFHENQFTYPLAEGQHRDYHFAYSNVLTSIAAQQIWFNSTFHRGEFSEAAVGWLQRMPDYRHIDAFQTALANSKIMPPGIDPPTGVSPAEIAVSAIQTSPAVSVSSLTGQAAELPKHARPPTIGWVSRWEHDKRPDRLLAAVRYLIGRRIDFSLILLGQQFSRQPASLGELQQFAGDRILHCGYVPGPEDYWNMLSDIDLVVSTADHEFFGIAILEALQAGARPLLPNKLAYPELLTRAGIPASKQQAYLYDSESEFHETLAETLMTLASPSAPNLDPGIDVTPCTWQQLAPNYDHEIAAMVVAASSG